MHGRGKFACFAALLALAAGGCRRATAADDGDPGGPKGPVAVRVATATRMDVPEVGVIEGTLETLPGHDVVIGAPFAGLLAELDVAPGDVVRAGQAIGAMHRSIVSAEAAAAAAAELRAHDEVEAAQRVFDRQRSLLAVGGTAQTDYENAKSALAKAQAELTQAQQSALAASATAGLAELRSPINGVVGTRSHNPGEVLDAGAPIVRIADTATLELDGHVAASLVGRLHAGMPVSVTTPALPGTTLAASFFAASSLADPGGATVAVRALLDNGHRPEGLRPGVPARGEVVLEVHRGAVVVPKAALVAGPEDVAVYVVGDGIAHRRVAEVGIERGDLVEIREGVAAGEAVAVGGMYGLDDGARVTTEPAGAASTAGPLVP